MSADNINTLVEAGIEVLERYAFLLGGPPKTEGGPAPLPEPSWMVTVAFAGAHAGAIGMIVPPALARQAAANLYGGEPAQMDDERAQDAAKELLNIVCGNYLHEIEGDGPVFDFAAPECRAVTRAEAVRCAGGKPQVALEVEGHPLLWFIER
ncbi:MAG: chemotaxis protein CheX [Verrucomicrobia bacterium]|nr:chemotaxis protein CheX [Verrucomicrobiota bacterium]